jgi:Kef-type K+ transport system membrane component KefB
MSLTDPLTLLAIFSACALLAWRFSVPMKTLGISASVIELVIGFFIGNWLIPFEHTKEIGSVPEIGAMILFFLVGLHMSIGEAKAFKRDIAQVAIISTAIAPVAIFALSGFLNLTTVETLFASATVMATGVGVVTRVLREYHCLGTKSGRFMLACAVVEDFAAILLLSFAASFARYKAFSGHTLIAFVALIFSLFAIKYLLRRSKSFSFPLSLTLPLIIIGGWITQALGLTSLLGAILAGLICKHSNRDYDEFEAYIQPLTDFFIPVFFILTGMRVKLETIMRPENWVLALGLTVIAFASHFLCYFGIREETKKAGVDRLLVVFGMLPRGLPGLVFATTALNAGFINDNLFSALIIMVTATNMVGMTLLSSRLKKKGQTGAPH